MLNTLSGITFRLRRWRDTLSMAVFIASIRARGYRSALGVWVFIASIRVRRWRLERRYRPVRAALIELSTTR